LHCHSSQRGGKAFCKTGLGLAIVLAFLTARVCQVFRPRRQEWLRHNRAALGLLRLVLVRVLARWSSI
jgi:hypothetical protein